MSFINGGLGDVIALFKLANDIYKKCYVDVKDAPKECQRLVEELGTLKLSLKTIQDQTRFRDNAKVIDETCSPQQKELLSRCYKACTRDLKQFESLINQYAEIADNNHFMFWKKIDFNRHHGTIANLELRLKGHHIMIGSCFRSIDHELLKRLVQHLLPALEGSASLKRSQRRASNDGKSTVPPRLVTDQHRVSGRSQSSSSPISPPMLREDRRRSTLSAANSPIRSLRPPLVDIPLGSAVPDAFDPADYGPIVNDDSDIPDDNFDIASEIDTASERFLRYRRKEQASYMLPPPRHPKIVRPPEAVSQKFYDSAEDALANYDLSTIGWLRLGTWWHLKAQCIGSSCGDDRTWLKTHLNLLKASWILSEIVSREPYRFALNTSETRALYNHLHNGILHEFENFPRARQFTDSDMMSDVDMLKVFEPEVPLVAQDTLIEEDVGRWITVHEGDAGNQSEQVLSRTFVDASIGPGNRTVYNQGAPFLLSVFTRDGESEPQITICDQLGTWSFTHGLTQDDIERFSPDDSSARSAEPLRKPHQHQHQQQRTVQLHFGSEQFSMKFLNDSQLQKTIQQPKLFFQLVKARQPRETREYTEHVIFRCSLKSAHQLHPKFLTALGKKSQYRSCELRILERVEHAAWNATRRLVVTTSASTKSPNCLEFFLPMDDVQIKRESTLKLLVKWSDCSHEDHTRTSGDYNLVFSHYYQADQPNNAFEFEFSHESGAQNFQEAISRLSVRKCLFRWQNVENKEMVGGSVYEVEDGDPQPKMYRAIVLCQRKLDWQFSKVFYSYCDTDLSFKSHEDANRISLPKVHYAYYESNHWQEKYKPKEPAEFLRCVRRNLDGGIHVDFDDESHARDFMSSLSSTYKLTFACLVPYTSTKPLHRFGGGKRPNEGHAELQVWRKQNGRIRIASRWCTVSEKWLTFDYRADDFAYKKATVWFENTLFEQGSKINLDDIRAAGRKRVERERRLTYEFKDDLDRDMFRDALRSIADVTRTRLDSRDTSLHPGVALRKSMSRRTSDQTSPLSPSFGFTENESSAHIENAYMLSPK